MVKAIDYNICPTCQNMTIFGDKYCSECGVPMEKITNINGSPVKPK